ncbi:retrotransposon protein, putative, ty1-copia subclass [Tanacetum coccineum]
MVLTNKVDKTPYELWHGKVLNLSYLKVWGCEALVKRDTPDKLQQTSVKYAKFFEKNLITQEVSGRAIDLEEIQDEDTSPSKITSKIPMEVEGFEPPQEEVISIRRSERTHRAPNHLCLNIEVDEHSLGDLNEPTSYKAVMLDSESNKWIDAMNAILISIAAFYDYEIWQNDVKTSFLNGYLDKDIYMVQPEGASTPEEVKRIQNVPYASAVGSIMYAVRYTRPDVAFAQNITSHFQQNPGEPHWTAVKSILKYLRNTKDMFLVYGGNPEAELRVDCYCDAGFETDKDDIKS